MSPPHHIPDRPPPNRHGPPGHHRPFSPPGGSGIPPESHHAGHGGSGSTIAVFDGLPPAGKVAVLVAAFLVAILVVITIVKLCARLCGPRRDASVVPTARPDSKQPATAPALLTAVSVSSHPVSQSPAPDLEIPPQYHLHSRTVANTTYQLASVPSVVSQPQEAAEATELQESATANAEYDIATGAATPPRYQQGGQQRRALSNTTYDLIAGAEYAIHPGAATVYDLTTESAVTAAGSHPPPPWFA